MPDVTKQVEDAKKTFDLDKKSYTAELETSKGTIRLNFLADVAPGHVKNFLALSKIGFYDNLTFHRIIADFMIQGGCPLGTGTGNGGYKINAEFSKTKHVPGILSMAHGGHDINSAGTQFFICLAAYPSLDGSYSAFGKVADEDSMKVLQAIGAVRTDSGDKPLEKVTIKKVTVKESPK